MYDHTLHHGKKYFCCHFLQTFSSEEMLKHYIKHCLRLMVSKGLRCLKKLNLLDSKLFEENLNPDEPYMSKYQKRVACSYGYDKLSKPFK